MSRFFIALLPPQRIQDYANQIKQYFAEQYTSQGAQKSPPHITLQPPFVWEDAKLPVLGAYLQRFASGQQPLTITLQGFAAFPPRVIYINVVKSQALLNLQADLMAYMESPEDHSTWNTRLAAANSAPGSEIGASPALL